MFVFKKAFNIPFAFIIAFFKKKMIALRNKPGGRGGSTDLLRSCYMGRGV